MCDRQLVKLVRYSDDVSNRGQIAISDVLV